MSIDDKVNPYEAPGIPYLKLAEAVERAEETARLLRANANMYTLADNPDIYRIAEEAEQLALAIRAEFEHKYHKKDRKKGKPEPPNPYDLSGRF